MKNLKPKPNIPKSENKVHKMQDCSTTTTGNAVKNKNMPRKSNADISETLKQWDQLLSKTNVFGCNRPTPARDTAKVPKCAELASNNNESLNPKTKINNPKPETAHAEQVIIPKKMNDKKKSNLKTKKSMVEKSKITVTNKSDYTKEEIEKLNNHIKQLNEQLKQVMNELSDEKHKCQNMKAEKKNELRYKEKLDIVLAEKDDLRKRLKECELLLSKSEEKMNSISEESERKAVNYSETYKKIEEDRQKEWNRHQIELESQNTEYQKALCRKTQFIQHLEFTIDCLTQEKHDFKNSQIEITKSNSQGSEELEMCKNQLNRLSNIVENMTSQFSTAEASFQQKIMEMRNTIAEKDEVIDSLKSKLFHQPETTLNSAREMTTDILNFGSLLDYNNCKW